MPRHRLDGCACTSPLAHFYIYHSGSSIRELHPFTTTTHLASQNTVTDSSEDDISIKFLFRGRGKPAAIPSITPAVTTRGFGSSILRLGGKLRRKQPASQWTDRLASLTRGPDKLKTTGQSGISLATSGSTASVPISLRLEGPYFTTADPASFHTVICLVAGTGVSGGLAIASAFKELERQEAAMTAIRADGGYSSTQANPHSGRATVNAKRDRIWKRCIVFWSVREEDFIDLPGFARTFLPSKLFLLVPLLN